MLYPFLPYIFQKLDVCILITSFEKEAPNHLCILFLQLHPRVSPFVLVFQYWYEYQGKTGSTSRDLFFHLCEVFPAPKDVVGHWLVSLRRAKNEIFKVYTDK